MPTNVLQKIFFQVRIVNDHAGTSQICANMFENYFLGYRVFFSISVNCVKSYSLYENDNLVISLMIDDGKQLTRWLTMKKSNVVDAGFGVFAEKCFEPNEFITAYLGKKIDYTYMYGELVSIPTEYVFKGIHEEYWLGHRINHGSGSNVNAMINSNLVISAVRKIDVGEELLIDYHRDVYCYECKKFGHLLDIYTMERKCVNCGRSSVTEKQCRVCEKYICRKCYDTAQIRIDI